MRSLPRPTEVTFQSSGGTANNYVGGTGARPGASITSYLRQVVDLTHVSRFRLVVLNTSSARGVTVLVRYTTNTDCTTGVADLDTGTGGDVPLGTGTAFKLGAWAPVVLGARQPVCLTIWGYGATNSNPVGSYRQIGLLLGQ